MCLRWGGVVSTLPNPQAGGPPVIGCPWLPIQYVYYHLICIQSYVYCHSSATLTEVFPCFCLSCKANVRIKFIKMGQGPQSSKLVVICIVLLLFVLFYVFCIFVVLCTVCVKMCTVLLPLGVNPLAVDTYTGCNRSNGPDFGRAFLRSYYTDITQNSYIQSSMVTEILAREVWNFDSCYSLIDYQIHIETGRNMWFL